MKKNNIAIFGVPWHPRWSKKIRYFPASHFIYMDLDKIKRSDIDFSPAYTNAVRGRGRIAENKKAYAVLQSAQGKWRLPFPWRLRQLAKFIIGEGRQYIGASRDVGYKIYEKFYNIIIRSSFSLTIKTILLKQLTNMLLMVLIVIILLYTILLIVIHLVLPILTLICNNYYFA